MNDGIALWSRVWLLRDRAQLSLVLYYNSSP
jgi:hypothetical protein